MNKRHAKPTTAQLLNRIYRRLLALESNQADIGDIVLTVKDDAFETRTEIRSALAMISTRLETICEGSLATTKTLADHCARLLREKETLMAERAFRDSNAYMSYPLKSRLHETDEAGDFLHTEPTDFETPTMSLKNYYRGRLNIGPCGFALLHQPGIRCAVCGELEPKEESDDDAH